eukprot:GHVR01092933.1.p1 GENE.GHVR01092933.1~~GHVR01092933.1.p1  ORF type:complete len:165 (+),score=13.46 GHVR01092933.1:245-739(+)
MMTHPHTAPILRRLSNMVTKLTNRLQMGSEYLFTYDQAGLDQYVWSTLLKIFTSEQSMYLTWVIDTLDSWTDGSIPYNLLHEAIQTISMCVNNINSFHKLLPDNQHWVPALHKIEPHDNARILNRSEFYNHIYILTTHRLYESQASSHLIFFKQARKFIQAHKH